VIKVLISAPVRLYRDALAELLTRQDDIVVVGAVGGQNRTLAALQEVEPDIVLLDLEHDASVETIRELAAFVQTKVVGVAASNDEEAMVAYAEAGVAGFVNHEDDASDLAEAIHCAARGEFRCSPRTAGTLLRHIARLAADSPNGSASTRPLTGRERDVMLLLEEGLSNKQIAASLQIELPTVKHHVHHILEKLEVSRRSEAVARARRAGLLESTL
jgi:two-component system nitrate/nitrite response regulator NarL